jgi:single-stranded DNA-binding protein
MQYITIRGNIGKDGVIKDVRGRDVLSFSVGVKQGSGDNTSTNWYRVQVWGKLAQTLLPKAVKGVGVVALGDLKIGEYNGKPTFDVDANKVEFIGAPKAREYEASKPAYQEPSFGDDLEDQIPF